MNILCFDISTGGATAAVFNNDLQSSGAAEIPWKIPIQPDGAAVLEVDLFTQAFANLTRIVSSGFRHPIHAISFSAFMHNSLLLDAQGHAATPIFTWVDRRGSQEVERVRNALGARFHAITGCRYHPMFPIFKLASMGLTADSRIASAKCLAIAELTGNFVEDHGTASATGLYDVQEGTWSDTILDFLKLNERSLPGLVERNVIIGKVTNEAADRFGLTAGTPVIAGSGDGFLANTGSGCDIPGKMAVTLGTSASARLLLSAPVLEEAAGTFCYRAKNDRYLLGCASSNGGNVLDWGRSVFGHLPFSSDRPDLPIFLPLLNGERSPDWNENLTASWHDVGPSHTASDLAGAVVEGVTFNLAHYVGILESVSRTSPAEIILSGNGFLDPFIAPLLASLINARVLQPRTQGQASLRGAAICAFEALKVDVSGAIEAILADSTLIAPAASASAIRQRYARYRELRSKA